MISLRLVQSMLALIVLLTVSFPMPSDGLVCQCSNCDNEDNTCEPKPGGVCFAQLITDISGRHVNYLKGCLDDASVVICKYAKSDSHSNACCNDTDLCNAKLLNSPVVSCECVGNKKCKKDKCTSISPDTSCYTIIRNLGSTVTYEKACMKNCTDYHNERELRTCCYGDNCNGGPAATIFPSVTSTKLTVTPTKTSYAPPLLTEATTVTPAPPTTDPDDLRQGHRPLICHCSTCRDGGGTCLASVACASYVVESVMMGGCVEDNFTCENDTYELNCCYKDYCNVPTKPTIPGPPCDDEDSEQSGGCYYSIITSSTTSSSTTATTAATTTTTIPAEATPTSSSKATPIKTIIITTETKYDDSNTTIIFYFFVILLTICIILMVIVIVACVALVCHYRGMVYKTTLSSTTILESAMKEKGYHITSNSPV